VQVRLQHRGQVQRAGAGQQRAVDESELAQQRRLDGWKGQTRQKWMVKRGRKRRRGKPVVASIRTDLGGLMAEMERAPHTCGGPPMSLAKLLTTCVGAQRA